MSATDGRLALAGIFGATPQLVSGGGVAQSGTNMQFTCAQSVFEVADVTNAAAAFFSPVDATVLTPANGPGSGSRKDLICVRAKNYENADPDSQATYILVAGVAGSPGVEPAVPAGYFKYATITVPTSASLATSCTVVIWSPTTFGPPELKCPTYAQLITVTGQTSQLASVYADGTTSNNGIYLWSGTQWAKLVPQLSYQAYAGAGTANGATLGTGGTFVVPQRSYAQTVIVNLAGNIAASGATTGGIAVTASAGGTVVSAGAPAIVLSGSGVSYASIAIVTIAAGAGTVTLSLTAVVAAGTLSPTGNAAFTVYPS